MNFEEYIKPELLILVPVLYLVGAALKKSSFPDKHIPLLLGFIGIILSGVYLFSVEPIAGSQAVATAIFTAITQGILVAGASVYINEIITQEIKKE